MDNRFYFGFNTSEERKKRRKAELYSMSEQVSTFFWDEAPQHGLEMREGQQDMSFEIVDALINDQHFAIEAGVGIGKSFGYLVPVLLYSKRICVTRRLTHRTRSKKESSRGMRNARISRRFCRKASGTR